MKVTKRDNTKQDYDIKKVKNAIYKAFKEKYGEVDEHLERDIDDITLRVYDKRYDDINVETIQDMVESEIMSSEYFDVAKIYILYRKEKTDERTKEWEMNELQKDIYNSKYRYEKESFDDFINRVSGGNTEVAKAIRKREFMPAGRVLAGRGLSDKGVKISLTNCFFIEAPEDNIPSIMKTASDMAVTYSRGGGCGTDVSKLRPRDAKVNNAARSSTGAVSFMELYSLVTGLISMKGRRGALMLTMSIDHPDIMEFIDVKTNLDNVTNANISVKITDEFMEKVENNEEHIMEFFVESTGETIRRTVRAKDLLYKLAENNHRSGEPGMLFWDNITNWSIMSEDDDYEYAGTNPCGEQPLINGGSCNLASINLSKLAVNPFTDKAYVDFDKLKYLTDLGIRYLDEVVDDNIKNQPLEIQRQMAEKYRNCGLGFLGLSDLLIKMGYKYGKEESINLVDKIGKTMIEQALLTSTQLAEEKGAFPGCNVDAILQAPFVQENATEEILERIQNYGLRNSSLLSIAPNGTISILCGASSGGIEPLFQISYNRTTKSLHGEDRVYKVYADVVAELMEAQGIENEEELPDYVVTSSDVNYKDRIKMQSTVQKYIDTAISSTINLPEETTVETIADIYYESWRQRLKGIHYALSDFTIYQWGYAIA